MSRGEPGREDVEERTTSSGSLEQRSTLLRSLLLNAGDGLLLSADGLSGSRGRGSSESPIKNLNLIKY